MPETERKKKIVTINVIVDGRYDEREIIHNLEEMLASELIVVDWSIELQDN